VKIILALTGASGIPIGIRLAEVLQKEERGIVVSENAKKVDDMVDFIVGKVLDSLRVENKLYKRWTAR
jgi:3-polyprenyl-4-hydroxybenzoate decarboxylase